jgi:hypothetical protein
MTFNLSFFSFESTFGEAHPRSFLKEISLSMEQGKLPCIHALSAIFDGSDIVP